jgi:hypothetical protein
LQRERPERCLMGLGWNRSLMLAVITRNWD